MQGAGQICRCCGRYPQRHRIRPALDWRQRHRPFLLWSPYRREKGRGFLCRYAYWWGAQCGGGPDHPDYPAEPIKKAAAQQSEFCNIAVSFHIFLLLIAMCHAILFRYNWTRKTDAFRSCPLVKKEGDAHDYHRSPDFTVSYFCGFDLHR